MTNEKQEEKPPRPVESSLASSHSLDSLVGTKEPREFRVDREGYIEIDGNREFVGLLLAGALITR